MADAVEPGVVVSDAYDARALARVHSASFPDAVSTRLGSRYLADFFRFFLTAPSSVAVTIASGGRMSGYVVGIGTDDETDLSRALRIPGVRALLSKPRLLVDGVVREKVRNRIENLLHRRATEARPIQRAPTWVLYGIGVSPEARGSGIGRKLVAAFEERAVRRGAKSVLLSVYANNAAARALYERCGWSPIDNGAFAGRALFYVKELS